MTVREVQTPEAGAVASPPLSGRSVAIVHEWFSAHGGSETVFRHIADLLPHAERFVLWREADAPDDLRLRESWLRLVTKVAQPSDAAR